MVCAPVRSIIPSLKLGDYLSVQAHKPCSISHLITFLQRHFSQALWGAPEAQWVKRWPTELAVLGSSHAGGEIFSTVNGIPWHRTFHYYPPIVLIWLKYCWKVRKIARHPSFFPAVYSLCRFGKECNIEVLIYFLPLFCLLSLPFFSVRIASWKWENVFSNVSCSCKENFLVNVLYPFYFLFMTYHSYHFWHVSVFKAWNLWI